MCRQTKVMYPFGVPTVEERDWVKCDPDCEFCVIGFELLKKPMTYGVSNSCRILALALKSRLSEARTSSHAEAGVLFERIRSES